MWELQCLTTLWASTACFSDSFTFLYPFGIMKTFIVLKQMYALLKRVKTGRRKRTDLEQGARIVLQVITNIFE
jgi:hypothetical protein